MTNKPGDCPPSVNPAIHVIVVAWGSVLATWLAWLLLSLPGFGAHRQMVGLAVVFASFVGFVMPGSCGRSVRVGAAAGFLAGLTNLLVLGSDLADPREGAPPLLMGALGYLLLSTLLGAIGVWVAGRVRAWRSVRVSGASLARQQTFYLCVALLVLLLLGGAVTSTRSGLAVPDWPKSFGVNMFLLPFSRMTDPNVFAEHSHRLFGAMVGVTALATFAVTLISARLGRPVAMRWIGVVVAGGASIILLVLTESIPALKPLKIPAEILAAIASGGSVILAIVTKGPQGLVAWIASVTILIGLQGYLGGSRVVEQSQGLAIFHGVLAHLIFAIVVAQWFRLSDSSRALEGARLAEISRRVKTICAALLHTTILQVVLGAIYRHLKETSEKGAGHTLYMHMFVSLVVVVFAIIAGFMLMRESRKVPQASRAMRFTGMGLIASVSLQFILGWAAMVAVMMAPKRGAPPTAEQLASATTGEQTKPVPPGEVAVTVSHHTNGAILLGLCSGAVVLAKRLKRASAAETDGPESREGDESATV